MEDDRGKKSIRMSDTNRRSWRRAGRNGEGVRNHVGEDNKPATVGVFRGTLTLESESDIDVYLAFLKNVRVKDEHVDQRLLHV